MAIASATSASAPAPGQPLPVLIVGAGISGLLLAQHLARQGVPFRVFERDGDFATRGVGWGLTLHWSLPAVRELLAPELHARLGDTFVDRRGVEAGLTSRFPFYDLSTGERKAATPEVPHAQRIRVTRERLRRLLATGIDIEWGKAFRHFAETPGSGSGPPSVTATFDDGTSCAGRLLVACDGGNSRVRRALFPKLAAQHRYAFPVRVVGVKVRFSAAQMAPLRELDPFFLQGCASANDSFAYLSVLDAPGNNEDSLPDSYSVQICVSWPYREGFFGQSSPLETPESSQGRHELLRAFAKTYAEPFRSLVESIPEDTEVKHIDMHDWAPPRGLRSTGRVVLMGDALHQMAMYRGEGANHAIVDVLDFAQLVVPVLHEETRQPQPHQDASGTEPATTNDRGMDAVSGDRGRDRDQRLRGALDRYEDTVVERARPGVLASRRACLDAHDWPRIGPESPLLSRRQMRLQYEYDDDEGDKVVC